MAEENEGQEIGAEASGAGVDPAAVALALGGASRERADAFLKDQQTLIANQNAFIADQRHHLHEQLKSLHLSIWEKRAGLLLRVATAIVGLGVVCFLGAIVWNAAHADGLIVESFSVPPDLAARGLTGQAIAGQLMDKLSGMQSATTSVRAERSYSNNWGDDINVEIPETGVSVGEAYRFLKSWLGHETHVNGDVWRTQNGLAIAARVSGSGSNIVTGAETELDSMIQSTAEDIYGSTQRYRYSRYLFAQGRWDEALAIVKQLATAGPEEDRPWGYDGWSIALHDSGTPDTTMRLFERGLVLQPNNAVLLSNLIIDEIFRGFPEKALSHTLQIRSVLDRGGQGLVRADSVAMTQGEAESQAASLTGDFQRSAQFIEDRYQAGVAPGSEVSFRLAQFQTGNHDLVAAHAAIAGPAETNPFRPGWTALEGIMAQMGIDSEAQDWTGLVSRANGLTPLFQKFPSLRSWSLTETAPLTAYANARLGNITAAEAEIAPTPGDCYDCLISRARIAEVEGQHARADWWFDRAVQANPSIPFAYADWAVALLERSQPDAAIEKFKVSNQKGPHFADPLEGWGEALIEENRSDLALAKFEEADKYAPNWGRLHLKWGEALGYAGRKEEAAKQFAQAAQLDLSEADKAELAKVLHG